MRAWEWGSGGYIHVVAGTKARGARCDGVTLRTVIVWGCRA